MRSNYPFGRHEDGKPFWRSPLTVAHIVAIGGLGVFTATHIEPAADMQSAHMSSKRVEVTCEHGNLLIDNQRAQDYSSVCEGNKVVASKLATK